MDTSTFAPKIATRECRGWAAKEHEQSNKWTFHGRAVKGGGKAVSFESVSQLKSRARPLQSGGEYGPRGWSDPCSSGPAFTRQISTESPSHSKVPIEESATTVFLKVQDPSSTFLAGAATCNLYGWKVSKKLLAAHPRSGNRVMPPLLTPGSREPGERSPSTRGSWGRNLDRTQ